MVHSQLTSEYQKQQTRGHPYTNDTSPAYQPFTDEIMHENLKLLNHCNQKLLSPHFSDISIIIHLCWGLF